MKKTKNFISALILTALSMSIASCGSSSSSSSSSNPYADVDVNSEVRNELNQAASNSDLLEDVELENKTIKWMANWDINPDASGKNKPPELVVFEKSNGFNATGQADTKNSPKLSTAVKVSISSMQVTVMLSRKAQ